MSTICRVKVHIESQQPFWMLINLEECRHIKDIFTKIQAVCPSKCAEDLFLDGCFLPPHEASRILRDNDTVHVKISDTSEVSTENTQVHNEQGKQKKKKSKHFIYDNHDGKQNKDRKWICSNLDKEIEVENSSEKKDGKTTNKCIVVSEVDMKNSDFVDSIHYFDSTSEVNVLRAVSEVPCSLPAVTLTLSDVKQDKMSSSSTVNASENSQRIMDTKSNTNLLSESSVTFKTKKTRKRKRMHKRKMENSCEKTFIFKEDKKDGSIFNTSGRMQSEPKFTKSHKPSSKKIIFTSDEESFSEQHVTPICNDMNDSSNKIILENPENSCLITKDIDGIDTESNLIKNQQTSFQLQQAERHLKIPVNNNSHDKLIHSDLANYLRMSPEERGITLPHYLKAERISNGAMMYIRTTHTPNSMCVQTSPPFKFGGEQKPEDKVHATFVGNGLFQQQIKSLRTVEEASMKLADNLISSKNMIMALPLYRDYSKFPDLQFPKAGDHIAFKVLELKEDYTPAVSEYKEAEILEYENHMKMVRIRLLKKNMEIKKKMPGKFDILDNTIVEEDVSLELAEMLEPKLLTS